MPYVVTSSGLGALASIHCKTAQAALIKAVALIADGRTGVCIVFDGKTYTQDHFAEIPTDKRQ